MRRWNDGGTNENPGRWQPPGVSQQHEVTRESVELSGIEPLAS
jgi:hypothetical protein